MHNNVTLLGRIGTDPDLKYTASSKAVCNFTFATSKTFRNAEGKKQENTSWHNIVVWGKTAEFCANYIKKGSQAFIEGEIQYRDYEDKNGNKRYITEIVAFKVQNLSPRVVDEDRGPTDPVITTEDLPF